MENIKLYTNPMSRGLTTLWMLEECSATYDIQLLSYGESMKTPEYLAINPMGKVPALKYGDTVITETAAIVTYLADQFPDKQLAPTINTPERGEYYRWLFFCASTFEYALINQFLEFKTDNVNANKMLGCGEFESVLKIVENKLNQSHFLVSNHFTSVDLMMTSLIMFGINKLKLIPENSIFMEYANRHQQRPAFQKTLKITQSLME